jgi:glycosyltransferase involved in cell wall biosynthesis
VPRFVAPLPATDVARGISPTFSVIIAAFEAASTLGAAVASALDQVPAPHEVIVCDDGSTDDVPGALAPFEQRVVLLRQANRGEAAAKNTAAKAATGEFVVILDADDEYLPGRLAALADLATARPDLDILTSDAYLEADGRRIGTSYSSDHRFAALNQRRAILDRNFIFGLAAIRRSRLLAVGGFDESISHATDWDCWVRLVLDGARAGLVDEPLAVYRLHRGAANASRVSMAEGRQRVLLNALAHPSLDADERAFVRARIQHEQRKAEWERLRDDLANHRKARSSAWRVARNNEQPLTMRMRAALAVATPSVARVRLARNAHQSWTTVGDLRLPITGPG